MTRASKRAALYLRVSSEAQAAEGTTSLDEQERKTRAHSDRRGYDVVALFREEGFTGTVESRPAWDRLMLAAGHGEFDVVVFLNVGRQARDELAGALMRRDLDRLGVEFEDTETSYDRSTDDGKLIDHLLLGVYAHQRRSLLRTMASGAAGKARRGGWPSSTATPCGLAKEGKGREAVLVIDEDEALTIELAAKLLVDEAKTITQVCLALNAAGRLPRHAAAWNSRLLRDMLSQPARMGRVIWGKPRFDAQGRQIWGKYGEPVEIPGVPAVLTEARFNEVQAALARTSISPAKSKRAAWPLSGMSAPCGGHYVGRYRNDADISQYVCSGTKWRELPGWEPCGCTRLRAEAVERRVWDWVYGLLTDEDRLRQLAADWLELAGGQDEEAQETELARREAAAAAARKKLTDGIANCIRLGLDEEATSQAVGRLQAELRELERSRDELARWVAQADQRRTGADSLEDLATVARNRLSQTPGLDEMAWVFRILGLTVRVLDQGRTPELEIRGDPGSLAEALAQNPAEVASRAG
jgi:DNA invertase Pin-like site-specific DNA recombinase